MSRSGDLPARARNAPPPTEPRSSRAELAAFIIPADEMTRLLAAAGGPTTARDLGLPKGFYREAIVHCREMRNRFSFLDIAADAGYLEDFAAGED